MCCDEVEINANKITMIYDVLEKVTKEFSYPGAVLSLNSLPVLRIKKDKWVCLSGVSLICKTAKKMAGLGDNISSAGFVHHFKKNIDNP